MAKIPQRIQTISPELLREIKQTVDVVARQIAGDLQAAPEPPPKAPDDYIIKTPKGGIPRRRRRRITSAWCDVYKEVETAPATRGAAKTLTRIVDGSGSPLSLPVYNVYCEDVPGGLYVPTALLKSGTRYVVEWIDCSESSSSSSEPPSSSSSSPSSASASLPSSSLPSSVSASASQQSPASLSASGQSASASASESSDGCPGECAYILRLGGQWGEWCDEDLEIAGIFIPQSNPYGCGPAEECQCPKTPKVDLWCTPANYDYEWFIYDCVHV